MSKEFPIDENLNEMVKENIWHSVAGLDYLVRVITDLSSEDSDWSWVLNSSCKYITIRIDMRDGNFTLTDREGERISIEQLKWQYNKEPAP